MGSKLVTLMLAGVAAFGQITYAQSGAASTSIYQTLFVNSSAKPKVGVSTNIGQVGHQVFLTFSNAPTKTCTNASMQAQLEFSYDNTNWTAFGNPVSSNIVQSLKQNYFGTGAFPFVRFNLVLFDDTNCLASAYYTGSFIEGC